MARAKREPGIACTNKETGMARANKEPGMACTNKEPGTACTNKEPSNLWHSYLATPPAYSPPHSTQARPTHPVASSSTLQVMWLHPPFFSMVAWHLGHSLVLAEIQLAVSESSAHFFSHRFASVHVAGMWSLRPHLTTSDGASDARSDVGPVRRPRGQRV